jgi:hypothetical protein
MRRNFQEEVYEKINIDFENRAKQRKKQLEHYKYQ